MKDLRAIRDLLDHHMDDLDDVFAMLREHGVDGALILTLNPSPNPGRDACNKLRASLFHFAQRCFMRWLHL